MKHQILFLGKTKDKYLQKGIEDFSGRLNHYTNLVVSIIKDPGGNRGTANTEHLKKLQGQLLLKSVPRDSVKIVLDTSGKQYSSPGLAELISGWELRGTKQVSYLIGGADGHHRSVIDQADLLLSLSKMTFTHDMVRLILIEQLYRAYTIKAGEKYHK